MTFSLKITPSNKISGLATLTPSIGTDSRGDIWTSFEKDEVEQLLPPNLYFKHDKFSESKHNVLRGIHGDDKSWKLVTCVYGHIFQVVTDLRKGSATFGCWQAFDINKASQKMVLIPPGCGNAYYVQSDVAVYHYKLAYSGAYIDAQDQFSVRWNDADIGIDWPVESPILSERDKHAPFLKDTDLG